MKPLLLVLLLLLAFLPPPLVRAQEPAGPVVGGVTLARARAATVDLFYDPDVDAETVKIASTAIILGLADVPELTGLPPFTTPIAAYILADEERFRLALAEIANVRTELVSEDIGGYTIERDGAMLIFFGAANVAALPSATIGFSHELAHLAVREATQRRPLPQWFNEGYASWISTLALARRHPAEAALQGQLDRASVASALHTRDLIPWADLVTRTRFSRAGIEGLVNLAYGQSTLFVDFLAKRHGVPALARFLTTIGEGAGATQAFTTAFGSFGSEVSAFGAALEPLKQELPPGLHVIQRADLDRAAVLALVGAPALEIATVELLAGGEALRRREFEIDGGGMMVASFPAALLEGDRAVSLRVTAPVLGTLELDPISGSSALPAIVPARAPAPSQPSAPPVQIPARSSALPAGARWAA